MPNPCPVPGQPHDPPRICHGLCGETLVRRPDEESWNFRKRRTCGAEACISASRNQAQTIAGKHTDDRIAEMAERVPWPEMHFQDAQTRDGGAGPRLPRPIDDASYGVATGLCAAHRWAGVA